jgi:hypothetical protein
MKTGLKRAARMLLGVGIAVGACSVVGRASAAVRVPELMGAHRATKAIPDEVFLQEVGTQVPSAEPLLSVAFRSGQIFAGTARGIVRLQGSNWLTDSTLSKPIHRLAEASGQLWAMGVSGLHRLEGDAWKLISSQPIVDVTEFRDKAIAVGGKQLFAIEGDALTALSTNGSRFAMLRAFPHQETLFVVGQGRLAPFAFGSFGGLDAYTWPSDLGWDWGTPPSLVTRDALSVGPCLYLATDRGLGVLRGMSMTAVRGEHGLPFEDLTCLAKGFTNDLWIGTTRGAIRQVDGVYHYFAGRRWVPGERVNDIDVQGSTVYLATDKGLGIIRYEPYTLLKKADYYERHLEEWGQKRLGFTHKLEWDAKLNEYVREVSDNDGGYTGNYLAAQCYRYAVTQDPAARREATNTFHALRWLEAMTGIPGFPARSVWAKGERGHQAGHGSGGYAAEWHDTADGLFEWKGDTSSDEICSHFYAFGLFLELVAEGVEKDLVKGHLARVATHLIDHQWKLVDLDGKPTRWGRWDPDYFLTDEGKYDRGLQAVELLSFIKTAEILTGQAKFKEAYQQLIQLGYPAYTLRARNTFPPDSILHFLDELAFWSYWNLLRYEQDPELRALYRRGYERSYEVVRVEQNPWFNFLYGALTGNDCEPVPSIEHLRGWPLDLRIWSYQNSHRADLRTPAGYVALKGGTRTFPPRETEPLRWDRWLMQPDGGAGGNEVVEPGAWLLAYWMGRYHGYIAPPTSTDPALLSIAHTEERERGARPYEGPGRPSGF